MTEQAAEPAVDAPAEDALPDVDYIRDAKAYVLIARGRISFKYGPYTVAEAGAIMERCHRENLAVHVGYDCGARPFDFDFAAVLVREAEDDGEAGPDGAAADAETQA